MGNLPSVAGTDKQTSDSIWDWKISLLSLFVFCSACCKVYTYTVTEEIRWKISHQFFINSQQKAFIIGTSARAFFRPRESTRHSVTRLGENSARGLALLMPNPLANLSPARLNYSRRRRNARLAALVIYKRLPEAPSVAWAQFMKVHDRIWQHMTAYLLSGRK